jgi:hypothetical protein
MRAVVAATSSAGIGLPSSWVCCAVNGLTPRAGARPYGGDTSCIFSGYTPGTHTPSHRFPATVRAR